MTTALLSLSYAASALMKRCASRCEHDIKVPLGRRRTRLDTSSSFRSSKDYQRGNDVWNNNFRLHFSILFQISYTIFEYDVLLQSRCQCLTRDAVNSSVRKTNFLVSLSFTWATPSDLKYALQSLRGEHPCQKKLCSGVQARVTTRVQQSDWGPPKIGLS